MRTLRRLGRCRRDGQDRSFGRLQDGFVCELGGAFECPRHLLDVGGPRLNGICPRPEDLRHDHAGVPSGPHKGTAPHGARDRSRRAGRAIKRCRDCFQGHDEVRSGVEVHAPGHGQQFLPRKDLTGVGDEGLQQGELAGGQNHRSSVDRYLAQQQVDMDAADTEMHVRREVDTGPEIGPYAGQEFLEREWLRQVVVRAEVEPLDPVIHSSPGAEHQNRNGRPPLPQPPEHLKPV